MMFCYLNAKFSRRRNLVRGLAATVIGGCFVVHAAALDSYAQRKATRKTSKPPATAAPQHGAVADKGNGTVALRRAAELLGADRLAEAESLLLQVVADSPRDAQARVLLGVL